MNLISFLMGMAFLSFLMSTAAGIYMFAAWRPKTSPREEESGTAKLEAQFEELMAFQAKQ